jgi:hypothetical protein
VVGTKRKIQFGKEINDLQGSFAGEGATMDPKPARIDVISAVVMSVVVIIGLAVAIIYGPSAPPPAQQTAHATAAP